MRISRKRKGRANSIAKLRAVLPDPDQSALLKVAQNVPLLSVERIAFTYDDKAMELRRGLYRTDKHYYRNELN